MNFTTEFYQIQKMKIKEKTLPTTSVSLTKTIEGKAIELLLHFNSFGEVLKVENDYLDLPEAAKVMIHGRTLSPEVRELMVWIRVLKHIFPMIASGLIEEEELPVELQPVADALREIHIEDLEATHFIKDKWTKQFYASPHKEKYRYFFRFFLMEKEKMPATERIIEQMEILADDNTFLAQLEMENDFAKTYLLCLLLQTTKAYYIEPMIASDDFSNLESLINYKKVGLEMKDEKLLEWLRYNQELLLVRELDNFKVHDETLNVLLNTFVQKMICGVKIITMNDEL